MKNINKIITNAGNFHADEVLATALLRENGFDQIIERKFKIADDELIDPKIMIFDIGGVYNPDSLKFDHHHNANLPASNILIADWLVSIGKIDVRVREKLQTFLQPVLDVDRGLIPNGGPAAGLNAIVRGFNPPTGSPADYDAAFDVAVKLCQQIIAVQIKNAQKAVDDEVRWSALEKTGKVAVQEDTNIILGWKELAKNDGIMVLVCPSNREGWQIISRNSNEFVVPEHESQTFRHASGFMAVYPDRESALVHAKSL